MKILIVMLILAASCLADPGEKLFNEKCSDCHAFTDTAGKVNLFKKNKMQDASHLYKWVNNLMSVKRKVYIERKEAKLIYAYIKQQPNIYGE